MKELCKTGKISSKCILFIYTVPTFKVIFGGPVRPPICRVKFLFWWNMFRIHIQEMSVNANYLIRSYFWIQASLHIIWKKLFFLLKVVFSGASGFQNVGRYKGKGVAHSDNRLILVPITFSDKGFDSQTQIIANFCPQNHQ